MKRHKGNLREAGNVLFLILIAVALFAALSYAVTSSSKGGGNGITKDKVKLAAAELIQYATSVEQAVSRMMLINQCSENQISFENPIVAGYTNGSSPADKSCHVFDVAGGGISKKDYDSFPLLESSSALYAFDFEIYPNNVCIDRQGIRTGGDGTDLVLVKPHVTQELCDEVNRQVGFPSHDLGGSGYDMGRFIGSYGTPGCYLVGLPAGSHAPRSFCVTGRQGGTTNDVPIFYHVLIPR